MNSLKPGFLNRFNIFCGADAYNKYVAQTGAVMDEATGLLKINTTQYSSLQSLFFEIGSVRVIMSYLLCVGILTTF